MRLTLDADRFNVVLRVLHFTSYLPSFLQAYRISQIKLELEPWHWISRCDNQDRMT
jgi:hypothetical protein